MCAQPRDAAGDEFLHFRNLAVGQQIRTLRDVCGDGGLGGIPEHEWQIVILRVLRVGSETLQHRPDFAMAMRCAAEAR